PGGTTISPWSRAMRASSRNCLYAGSGAGAGLVDTGMSVSTTEGEETGDGVSASTGGGASGSGAPENADQRTSAASTATDAAPQRSNFGRSVEGGASADAASPASAASSAPPKVLPSVAARPVIVRVKRPLSPKALSRRAVPLSLPASRVPS